MATLFALAALGTVGAALVAVLGLVWFVLKIVLLPVRLAFAAVKIVLGLTFGLLGGLAMLVLAPVAAVVVGGAALVAVVVAAAALLLPLLPFLLIGGIVWALTRRPAAAA
jgi:hypothetical protein